MKGSCAACGGCFGSREQCDSCKKCEECCVSNRKPAANVVVNPWWPRQGPSGREPIDYTPTVTFSSTEADLPEPIWEIPNA